MRFYGTFSGALPQEWSEPVDMCGHAQAAFDVLLELMKSNPTHLRVGMDLIQQLHRNASIKALARTFNIMPLPRLR